MRIAKITSVKYVGNMPTMDIEVKNKQHCFYGNGVAVSNSHSYSYAENAYLTAYCKAHFPHEFFTSYLKHSIGKPDSFQEIAELISNAKLMDIEVSPPNIRLLQREFKLVGKSPTFGLTNIKKVGDSVFDKILAQYNEYKKRGCKPSLEDMNFDQFLLYYGPCIKSDAMQAFILSGACDCFGLNRLEMEYRYNLYKELSDRELKYIASQINILHRFKSLNDFINYMILNNNWDDPKRPIYRKARLDALDSILSLLESRVHNLQDSLTFRAMKEQEYLGASLTCSKVDDHDTTYANCTCKEFVNGFDAQSGIAIAAELKSIREWTIKAEGESKGKKMAFITIGDSTCDMDNAVMFAEDYEKFKERLVPKSVFMFRGMRQKKKNGFLIKNVSPL